MTQNEMKYVKKLKEINKFLSGSCSFKVWSKVARLETELEKIGKQCQFEIICDPDIFEASANEHFEQEGKIKP